VFPGYNITLFVFLVVLSVSFICWSTSWRWYRWRVGRSIWWRLRVLPNRFWYFFFLFCRRYIASDYSGWV